MNKLNQSWSLIIFCFNEVESISGVINSALTILPEISDNSFEIIIVDDGSNDGSIEVINGIAEKHQLIKVIAHGKNKGIGKALISGYIHATKENVCAVPADGQFDLKELLNYGCMDKRTILSFYRIENTQYNLFRNSLSYLNKIINGWINGVKIKDVNWVKVYKREELQRIKFECTSSLVESEICSKLVYLKNDLIEVKSEYKVRKFGKQKGNSLKIIWLAFIDTLKLIYVLQKFKFKSKRIRNLKLAS